MFVLYNYYRDAWLVTKLATMLSDAFGHAAAGATLQQRAGGAGRRPAGGHAAQRRCAAGRHRHRTPCPTVGGPAPKPATDDWPFLYLRTPLRRPTTTSSALAIVLLGALHRGRARGARHGHHHPPVQPALLRPRRGVPAARDAQPGQLQPAVRHDLAGQRAGVLRRSSRSVLLAIFINCRFPIRRPTLLYALLFVAHRAWRTLVPPEILLIDPPWLRYLLAAVARVRARVLRQPRLQLLVPGHRTADMAFASNLLGAMVGGALEYLALVTGYQALLLVVAGLYGLAWLFATRFRLGADKELSLDEHAPTSQLWDEHPTSPRSLPADHQETRA